MGRIQFWKQIKETHRAATIVVIPGNRVRERHC